MRKEALNYWLQAKKDFEVAKGNQSLNEPYAAIFFCHQAVEKALKAIFIIKKQESPGSTHSLLYLAKEVHFPENLKPVLIELSPAYITTRYPDATGELPYKIFDKTKAEYFIKFLEVFFKWAENQIK